MEIEPSIARQSIEETENSEFESARVLELQKRKNVNVSGLGESSDIIHGAYEGGLKVWECSRGLTEFVSQNISNWLNQFQTSSPDHPLRVLEIGCGHGLPGIAAMLIGGQNKSTQNSEVLSKVTIQNVTRNCGKDIALKCRYFYGDWSKLPELFKTLNVKYDIVVSSDTVYCAESIGKLVNLIGSAMGKPLGMAFISGRKYYFGVGGGTSDLCFEVSSNYPQVLKCKQVQHIQSGVERETIQISFI